MHIDRASALNNKRSLPDLVIITEAETLLVHRLVVATLFPQFPPPELSVVRINRAPNTYTLCTHTSTATQMLLTDHNQQANVTVIAGVTTVTLARSVETNALVASVKRMCICLFDNLHED